VETGAGLGKEGSFEWQRKKEKKKKVFMNTSTIRERSTVEML
jgi:hypothetical protein